MAYPNHRDEPFYSKDSSARHPTPVGAHATGTVDHNDAKPNTNKPHSGAAPEPPPGKTAATQRAVSAEPTRKPKRVRTVTP